MVKIIVIIVIIIIIIIIIIMGVKLTFRFWVILAFACFDGVVLHTVQDLKTNNLLVQRNQCRSKGNITGGARGRQRRELLGGHAPPENFES